MFPGNGNAGGAGGGNWNQGSPPSGSGMYDKSLPFPDAFGFKGSMQQQQSGGVVRFSVTVVSNYNHVVGSCLFAARC